MKKFFQVASVPVGSNMGVNPYFADKAAAIDQAKRNAAANQKSGAQYDVYVLEAVSICKVPVPDIEVTDLK